MPSANSWLGLESEGAKMWSLIYIRTYLTALHLETVTCVLALHCPSSPSFCAFQLHILHFPHALMHHATTTMLMQDGDHFDCSGKPIPICE